MHARSDPLHIRMLGVIAFNLTWLDCPIDFTSSALELFLAGSNCIRRKFLIYPGGVWDFRRCPMGCECACNDIECVNFALISDSSIKVPVPVTKLT